MRATSTPSRTAATHWRRISETIRQHGRDNNLPCHLCRGRLGPIDYRTKAQADDEARRDGHYWLIGAPRPLAYACDHIIPHAQGGPDSIDNAAPSHKICNERAGAKHTPRQRTHKPKPMPGEWIPNNGQGEPLPGHAIPGTTTATHTFQAQGGRTPGQRQTHSRGAVHTSTVSGPPRARFEEVSDE